MHRNVGRILYGLAIYAVPLLVGLGTLLALTQWPPHGEHADPQTLGFRVVIEPDPEWSPADARAALQTQAPVLRHDTQLSEIARWFQFRNSPPNQAATPIIELPSRHALSLACWEAHNLTPVGTADRQHSAGRLSPVRAGFAIALDTAAPSTDLLCRATFVGPARLTLQQWAQRDLQAATEDFQRKSGLLDGSLIMLALFVLITALINRSGTYVLFSVWLIVNLRMGALSMGWDAQWLSAQIPFDWLLRLRLVTTALYAVLTVTLFSTLFREDLSAMVHAGWLRVVQWLCLPLLLLSFWLSYRTFLPLLWIGSAFGMAVMFFLLLQILRKKRSAVAVWYSLSMVVILVASLFEVISAAIGFKSLIGSINSVTAAMFSSLLTSLALATQMRQEHEQKLQAQAELKHTYDAIPIGLFSLNRQGLFMSANPALHGMLRSDVVSPRLDTWQSHFGPEAWLHLLQLLESRRDVEAEFEPVGLTGEKRRRFLVKATLAGGIIEGSLQDVSEKSRATEDLRFLAHHDPLTRTLNRRGMDLVFEEAMRQQERGIALALAYLDLDRFKLINDLHGHAVGDIILQQVCARVMGVLPDEARLGRVGGDEFLLLLPACDIDAASQVCRRVVDAVGDSLYQVGERAFQVRGSIGLVELAPGHSIRDIISAADRACREAKSGHHDNLMVYRQQSEAFLEHEAELRLVEQLSTSTATTGLHLEMQPIMSLRGPYQSLDFEVLLRMKDPKGHAVPTARLLAAAENSGRIGLIDRWVLESTMAWLRANREHLTRTRFVCLNLSGSSINDDRFMEDVFALLERDPEIASRLCLEITESVALRDIARTRQFVDRIRSHGAKVALDDFGAGYTSFSYLMELPGDLLKIDGSFIVNINRHPANVAIVEAIVSLARNLGMKTVAEWAEDPATVRTLSELGVDYVQGFVVARPQHPDNMLRASSSATFIQDAELIRLARTLEGIEPGTGASPSPIDPLLH